MEQVDKESRDVQGNIEINRMEHKEEQEKCQRVLDKMG